MARPRGKIEVVCQNPRCRYYIKEKGKDIIKSGKYKSTRGIIASIAKLILWAYRYIENNCPKAQMLLKA